MTDYYFRDKTLEYDTTEGPRTIAITAGVPQGAVLGPDFWNISYDELPRISFLEHIKLVGYADDIADLVTAKDEVAAPFRATFFS